MKEGDANDELLKEIDDAIKQERERLKATQPNSYAEDDSELPPEPPAPDAEQADEPEVEALGRGHTRRRQATTYQPGDADTTHSIINTISVLTDYWHDKLEHTLFFLSPQSECRLRSY